MRICGGVADTEKSLKEFASCLDWEAALRGWFQWSQSSRGGRGATEEVEVVSTCVKSKTKET